MRAIRRALLLWRLPPREVVEAAEPLRIRQRLRARGAVRRGEAAAEPPEARYAVALARWQQRTRQSKWGLLLTAALLGLIVFYARKELTRGSSVGGSLLAITALLAACQLVRAVRRLRAAPAAELANMRLLELAGKPYPPDADPRPTSLTHWSATVASLAINFVSFDLIYGAITVAVDGRAITPDRVIVHGALWGALMTIVITFRQNERDERARRPTAGTGGPVREL